MSLEQEDSMPLVWVEAEHIFVARGYIYRVAGRVSSRASGPVSDADPDQAEIQEDSETVLEQQPPDSFTVLSSRSPAQIAAMAPAGWARIEPAQDLDVGARLGETLVARRHGGNEYTVVHPTAYIQEDPAL
jgi:hypothetical protein